MWQEMSEICDLGNVKKKKKSSCNTGNYFFAYEINKMAQLM